MQQSNEMNIPLDKIPVGFLASKYIETTIDLAKEGKNAEIINVMQLFDDFIVQFKDKKYDEDIAKLQAEKEKKSHTRTPMNPFEESRAIFRILMSLVNRSGFVPVRSYEGDLVVEVDYEKNLKEEEDG